VLAVLLVIVILFFLASLILAFVTDIVDPGARTGIVIFFFIATPPLAIGVVILLREWLKTRKT
jgi:hypothetical protein